MKAISPGAHDTIILHIIYGMLTVWIPVPFADSIAADYIRRQMVSKLATAHGITLSSAELKTLSEERGGCFSFAWGCLANTLFFPIKLMIGKFMIILRAKHFIEAGARSYCAARLTEHVLRAQLLAAKPGAEGRPPA